MLILDDDISITVIGMGVNAVKSTSSFVHRGLFHHMTPLINTVTAKKMHTR
jgi:hypothetical protein